MSGDRAKLPKWAQQELQRLEQDLAHAEEKLAAGPEDSNTFADPYADAARPLGRDTTVEFRFGPETSEKIQVRIDGDKLYVYGGDSLAIAPRSSNAIYVKAERW